MIKNQKIEIAHPKNQLCLFGYDAYFKSFVRLFEKEHDLPRPYYIISSAESMSDVEKLKKLGADTVVSPTKLTAQRVVQWQLVLIWKIC